MKVGLVILLLLARTASADEAESRAIAFLSAEVPRWSRENRCFSCHNNGDAARALFRAGRAVDPAVLGTTVGWLESPDRWLEQKEEGPSTDRRLARVQFALALAAAIEAGRSADRGALRRAADMVEADQDADGSWAVEDGGAAGSPAAYGRRLATALAVRALRSDGGRHAGSVDRGLAWLRGRPIAGVVEAAAVLLVEPEGGRTEAGRRALDLIRRAQAPSGGWGPYPGTPTEPFDTALALLALAPTGEADAIRRGRAALVGSQLTDGSWPETTRPAGGESYAQRISTAGWATLALFASR